MDSTVETADYLAFEPGNSAEEAMLYGSGCENDNKKSQFGPKQYTRGEDQAPLICLHPDLRMDAIYKRKAQIEAEILDIDQLSKRLKLETSKESTPKASEPTCPMSGSELDQVADRLLDGKMKETVRKLASIEYIREERAHLETELNDLHKKVACITKFVERVKWATDVEKSWNPKITRILLRAAPTPPDSSRNRPEVIAWPPGGTLTAIVTISQGCEGETTPSVETTNDFVESILRDPRPQEGLEKTATRFKPMAPPENNKGRNRWVNVTETSRVAEIRTLRVAPDKSTQKRPKLPEFADISGKINKYPKLTAYRDNLAHYGVQISGLVVKLDSNQRYPMREVQQCVKDFEGFGAVPDRCLPMANLFEKLVKDDQFNTFSVFIWALSDVSENLINERQYLNLDKGTELSKNQKIVVYNGETNEYESVELGTLGVKDCIRSTSANCVIECASGVYNIPGNYKTTSAIGQR